jgi:prepilin-type N-terminal cleavage/methylation domain-containing protein
MYRKWTVDRALRDGLTLMELVVVLGVLALLAGLVVPKLADFADRSRSATQAYSTSDVSRQIEMYYGMNRKYPDGWDLLTQSSDPTSLFANMNALLTTSITTTDGGGTPTTAGPILTTATLSSEQISALSNVGIGHAFLHDATSAVSSSGTDRRHFGTGAGHDGTTNVNTFAVINKTAGSRGLSILINDFGLNPNKAANDTTLTRINANTYVAFGLGPKNTMVQTQMLEAPLMENRDSSTKYSRPIAVFEVANAPALTGSPLGNAKLVGVIGPDGRTKGMSSSDYANVNGVQPH